MPAPGLLSVLLTASAGAVDVIAFLSLGNVFASVMTGNMVLLGLAAGTADAALAIAAGLTFTGYVAGTLLGSRLAREMRTADRASSGTVRALGAELLVLAAFIGIWEGAGDRPGTGLRRTLLVLAAAAMGLQSAAIKASGRLGPSTTYMTGTLTSLVMALTRRGEQVDRWSAARLAGLVAGATLSAVLVRHLPPAVPVPPLCLLAATVMAIFWEGDGLPDGPMGTD